MALVSPEEIEKATQVMESVRDEWLQRPGVTAVDLGFKWSKGVMTTQLAIRVHVAKKLDQSELNDAELFPEEVDGIPVDVIEATYELHILAEEAVPEAAAAGRGKRWDTVPLGVSIGCVNSTAGTLGAKVIDLESGNEMILSNWHVMVGDLNAQAGLAVWQPGKLDNRLTDKNRIAELTRWVLGPYDAAVARLTNDRVVQTQTPEGRLIEDMTPPQLGMMVWKSGRSTGYTEGFIDGIKMKVPLSYRNAGTHMLEEVFRIVPRPGQSPGEISIGGDSGSIWVDEASGKAVGLHFAGESGNSPEHALAHDIGLVIKALNVRFPAQEPEKKRPPDGGGKVIGRRSFWQTVSEFFRQLFRSR